LPKTSFEQAPAHVGEAGRAGNAREHVEARAAAGLRFVEVLLHEFDKRGPLRLLAALRHALAAIGIVQLEERGLLPHAGRAETSRMLRVAFELDRSPVVATRDEPHDVPGDIHARRVEARFARHEAVGSLREVDHLVFLPATSAGQAGEREGRAHHLQEATTLGSSRLLIERHSPLALDRLGELRIVLQLREAPPVLWLLTFYL
jgi:hypothetical protein